MTFRDTSLAWIQPEPWMADANCHGIATDQFYPEKGESVRAAKRVCGRCTVTAECLTYAQTHVEVYGIWGGLSEGQRRRIRNGTPWPPKTCVVCGETFQPKSQGARTCSPPCRRTLAQQSMVKHPQAGAA